jgi:hypothetical protein
MDEGMGIYDKPIGICLAKIVDKSQAVGPCIGGLCPPKHFCAPDKECYPKGNTRRFFRDTAAGLAADGKAEGHREESLILDDFKQPAQFPLDHA